MIPVYPLLFTSKTVAANDVLDLNFAQFLEMLGQVLENDIAGISTAVRAKAALGV